MYTFFSSIRKQLAAQNKAAAYMRYAIGEIVLVVIGILIALQINNWNSYRKDRLLEKQYLENFLLDLKSDSISLTYFSNSSPKKIEVLLMARDHVLHQTPIKDTLDFINKMGYGGVGSRGTMVESKSTYDDIISTGNLLLLKNENLKQHLLFYYQFSEHTKRYLGNLQTEYATFMNSYFPFDSEGTFKTVPKEIPHILEALKSEEFLRLANSELTYAYALRTRVEIISKLNEATKALIKTELNLHSK
ncbi:DUF6090 family protein [Mangrovimonas sp. DI 80]|uniref:DUF6090 family protein n=1 Tax=Mangrovimonas sp. DI 80 TaxID=1779330 RepID=UPI0009780CD7|nr:DUF6090 family protein [Mangrovimonas sp. DI 80]OMP30388.1 hypothetical protein BKM32_13485 [Mangrovimonas sp. DI 80]